MLAGGAQPALVQATSLGAYPALCLPNRGVLYLISVDMDLEEQNWYEPHNILSYMETTPAMKATSMTTMSKETSSDNLPSTMEPTPMKTTWKETSSDHPYYSEVLKGFEILSLGATFVAAIQAQIIGTTVSSVARGQETTAMAAVNALHLSGLVFDLVGAFLAFLTARWLQRLTVNEKAHMETSFRRQANATGRGAGTLTLQNTETSSQDEEKQSDKDGRNTLSKVLCAWFSISLFIPLLMLVIGVACMALGLLIYAWSRHATVVAALFTASCVGTLPFIAGVFSIGRNEKRRMAIITRLSTMQGDW